jgi:broad specificity phosphatase PhoE
MTTRITLISSGATNDSRNATFGGSAPLAASERDRAAKLASSLPAADRILCAPDSACRETAAALSLAATIEPAWRDIDFGDWSGKSLQIVQAGTPDALAAWLADPACPPPGDGESMTAFTGRIGIWLDQHLEDHRRLAIVAPANGLRAAILHCLRAPPTAFRAVDIMPLTIIELSAYRGLWRLRIGDRAERG